MADYTITPANVLPSAGARRESGIATVAISAGQAVAINDPYATIILFDANAALPASNLAGIAENSAGAGQLVSYITSDPDFSPGFTATANATVIGSANPGGVCPDADATTGWVKTIIGLMTSTTKMNFSPIRSGVATP